MSADINYQWQFASSEIKKPDGLYLVKTSYLCAGFTVKDNAVVFCAPILMRRFSYWWTIAKRIAP